MKELKKRIKGLSAILLAVSLALCLVVRFSGVRASAAEIITTGINNTPLENCEGKEFSAIGDGLQYGSSGGYFAIEYKSGNDDIKEYLIVENTKTTTDGSNITYYGGVKISNDLPTQYKSIKITTCTKVTYTNTDGNEAEAKADDYCSIYKLTFAWVPNTTISIGQTVSLTTGTQYSFPSGSTHKVQGDPTVYYGTSFYVSSSGTYTIEQ